MLLLSITIAWVTSFPAAAMDGVAGHGSVWREHVVSEGHPEVYHALVTGTVTKCVGTIYIESNQCTWIAHARGSYEGVGPFEIEAAVWTGSEWDVLWSLECPIGGVCVSPNPDDLDPQPIPSDVYLRTTVPVGSAGIAHVHTF